jgi:hypothetical protein
MINSLLYNTALIIGTLVMLWYGSKIVVCMIRAFILSVSFYRWSVKGIKSEGRHQEWWRKLYIVVMWFQFLSWERGMQTITASYGTFRWWDDKSYRAKTFSEKEDE